MPSDAVARLAKWRTCEGCECEALTQPWGPEGEWLCESCLEALTFPEDLRAGFYLAMATMAFLGLVALALWWLLG
jgi:hypothetical protein